MEAVGGDELLRRVRAGEVTVLDVRPAEEYRAGHIPGALSIPLASSKARLRELPKRREIVAYCRGPYCVMAIEAVRAAAQEGLPRAAHGAGRRRVARPRAGRVEAGTEEARPMIFRPFYYFETGCAAYLFGCGGLGKCAVVDAHERGRRRLRRVRRGEGHAHHARHRHARPRRPSLGRAARSRGRSAPPTACTSPPTSRFPFEPLDDGQEIELGNTRVRVLHTPGHTPESICLVVTDLRRGTEPWFVLTGDTLFVGAVGRPDLPGHARENAGAALRQHPREAPHAAGRPRGLSRRTSRARRAARA